MGSQLPAGAESDASSSFTAEQLWMIMVQVVQTSVSAREGFFSWFSHRGILSHCRPVL